MTDDGGHDGDKTGTHSAGHLIPLPGFGRRLLDAFLPPLCLSCAVPIDDQVGLCPSCRRDIAFIHTPICSLCGRRLPPAASCAHCHHVAGFVNRYRAVFDYDRASRRLVLAFKYGDRLDAAPVYGRWMADFGADLVAEADSIVPIPLHWLRLWRRRYNQAAVLARTIGDHCGKPVYVDLLVRCRATKPQMGMNQDQRRLNVRGAFMIRPDRRILLAGRNILLIDDVLTSGATVEACAEILKNAGARSVDVLTLADARPSALSKEPLFDSRYSGFHHL